jgi:hypothetical protein
MSASGYTPTLSMGSLVAIPQSFNWTTLALETVPAKKLAWTLQNYGAYLVDNGGNNSGWGTELWCVEVGVVQDMVAAGVDIGPGTTNTPWYRDMNKIFAQLREVTNNTSGNIGGGGTPLQPLAPAIP